MKRNSLTILGIETSCDDTAAAVVSNKRVLSNVTASQFIHQKFGGVVPELAARAHHIHIIPIVDAALEQAGVQKADLHAIGFTQGPGLLGSLLIGNYFAKSLAFALGIPIIGVHHLQAHVLANFIDQPFPSFPFLCLIASGGHTQIGEAFDKIANLLGLNYPGGCLIDHYAKNVNPQAFWFPLTRMPGFNFSFSGIKTAFSLFIRDKDEEFLEANRADICASIQEVLVHMLLDKLVKAAQATGIHHIALAGGVASNTPLRHRLSMLAETHRWSIFIPAGEYCTDNAAMVAITACYQYEEGQFSDLEAESLPKMAV